MRIISSAPCRIGLFGGGTDTNPYAEKYGGVVINIAINLRQKVILGDGSKLLEYDNPDFFKAFTFLPVKHEFENDIESGLGTSAALAVSLVGASRTGLSRSEIAEKAWKIEVSKLGLFGGKQDQYASVFGGMNLWKFSNVVKRIGIAKEKAEKLKKYILLFSTGITRPNPKLQENLKVLTEKQKQALDIIKQIASDAYHRIYSEDYEGLGNLLNDSWRYKKMSNKVTNKKINGIYDLAISSGTWGGKLCGSGGGGHMIFMADSNNHEKIIYNLSKVGVENIPYKIDYDGLKVERIN